MTVVEPLVGLGKLSELGLGATVQEVGDGMAGNGHTMLRSLAPALSDQKIGTTAALDCFRRSGSFGACGKARLGTPGWSVSSCQEAVQQGVVGACLDSPLIARELLPR
jgi:hypothetical protein